MATAPLHDEETEQEIMAPAETVDSGTLALLNKSELDQAITTAKKYPRKLTAFLNTATALATQDTETSEECIYALPRDGKIIEGPSARFAEIVAYAWGNCRAGARVISEDEEFVTAQGSFFDLEQNVNIGYEVRRRITNKKGQRYNSDMISTTANAACSIALRNAVLKGVPKAMWRKIYDRARQTIAGDNKTLDSRRDAMIKAFQLMGAKPEQIFTLLDIKGMDDIMPDHLVSLRGVYNAIREGETTVARAFAPKDDVKLAEKSKANLEKIKEKYAQPVTVPVPAGDQNPEVEVLKQEADPARAEKLRAEAERQKKLVAEKYGASQPSAASVGDQAVAAADKEAAAPAPVQEPERSPLEPAEPGDVPSSPSSPGPDEDEEKEEPEPQPDDEESKHGIPLSFDDSPLGKSNRKR